ncbi:hypothetical protein [Bradyrhizobium sp. th.b2]|uniref:hypothetical protein n=1 Tax=Bradyrhizobium sp. th-b2 TaxID=172088 RepID=UPI001FDA43F4|nr:hypothetical protein [Bradyrhizobium sp. th.b2]
MALGAGQQFWFFIERRDDYDPGEHNLVRLEEQGGAAGMCISSPARTFLTGSGAVVAPTVKRKK